MSQKLNDKRDQLIAVSKLYYIEGLSQEEISKQLFVSRPTVSRLLKESLKKGIVQIRIDDISSHCLELAKQIEEKFGINKVIVAPSSYNLEESKQNVGASTALYLESAIKNGALLGIAWGTTLSYVVKNIRHNALKKTDVIQMLGGIGNKTQDTDANALALALASALDGDSYLLQAPFMVKSKVLRDLLMDEPYIKQHFEKAQDVSVALVGLGSVKPELSAQFRSGHITLEDAQRLKNEGAVGDICGRYIDINGNECRTSLTDRIITVSLKELIKIPKVIGVACGNEKKDIIIGALKGKYLDVLIIDKNAALVILEEET
ncbi:MAG: sugar-binding transcriptional regulator [Eubacteriaceae bacterium]